jgi:glutathione synthase/RimK-type ligase-like ATP-grasp enzyme
MGLRPSWLTPNGLFAITTADGENYINCARSPLNSHVGASLSKDKYLTRLILKRNGIPNIPFAQPKTQLEAKAFLDRYGKIIAKPVRGSGSRDVHIVTEISQLQDLEIDQYILEEYIQGEEMRYLVLNGSVVGVYRSEYGASVQTNRSLQCISFPKEAWDPATADSAVRIARILDLSFAAVDFLIDPSGQTHLLEVNTTPDLKWFHAPTSGPPVDIAHLFLTAILEETGTSPTDISLTAAQTL